MTEKSAKTPVAIEERGLEDGKLFSPSAERNSQPICEILSPRLPVNAHVLEIGSGTGQHGESVCLARPDIVWQPSDPDEASRGSLEARSRDVPGLQKPLLIDAAKPGWWTKMPQVDVLACSNVIHISPWVVTEGLASGASAIVGEGGFVYLYGPFLEGSRTAGSNLAFNDNLRARNAQWGVRDLEAVSGVFAASGFELAERIEMPANNLSLLFRRRA